LIMDNIQQCEVAPRPFRFTLKHLLFIVVGVGLICGLCVPLIQSAREAARRASCQGLRLGIIEMALVYYHDKYGCFPPAYIADKQGKPMHSWRVLILPFLGYDDLYKKYDFSEPWNGPKNSLLAKEMPPYYRCPSVTNSNLQVTNYVAVVGPGTVWPGRDSVSWKGITDGSSYTIMLVAVADSDINWMEPRDMSFDQAILGVNVDRKSGISSNHPGGAGYAMADGSHRFRYNGTSTETLRAMLTIAGGETIEEDHAGNLVARPAATTTPSVPRSGEL